MNDWIRTYINAIDTAVKDSSNGLNVKLAEIDSSLPTIPDAFVFKTYHEFQERPMFHQYINPSSFSEDGLISGYDEIFINQVTSVRSYDDESSGLINSVWVYWEAMLKAIYNTTTNPGQLSGNVCRAKPLRLVKDEGLIENKLVKEAGIEWQLTLHVNLQE